jgi:hypothetical protein
VAGALGLPASLVFIYACLHKYGKRFVSIKITYSEVKGD